MQLNEPPLVPGTFFGPNFLKPGTVTYFNHQTISK